MMRTTLKPAESVSTFHQTDQMDTVDQGYLQTGPVCVDLVVTSFRLVCAIVVAFELLLFLAFCVV